MACRQPGCLGLSLATVGLAVGANLVVFTIVNGGVACATDFGIGGTASGVVLHHAVAGLAHIIGVDRPPTCTEPVDVLKLAASRSPLRW